MLKTITWNKGDGTIAVTTILDETLDPAEHAAELLARGDVPAEYVPIAYDEAIPPSSLPLEVYRAESDGRVVIDIEAAKVEAVKILEQRGVLNAATLAQRATTVEDLEQELRSDRKG
jgi:hypothetical protein